MRVYISVVGPLVSVSIIGFYWVFLSYGSTEVIAVALGAIRSIGV